MNDNVSDAFVGKQAGGGLGETAGARLQALHRGEIWKIFSDNMF